MGSRIPKVIARSKHYLDPQIRKQSNQRELQYRTTVTLMNMDVQSLVTLLANTVQQIIEKIIPPEEEGFLPGMQGWYNTHKGKIKYIS